MEVAVSPSAGATARAAADAVLAGLPRGSSRAPVLGIGANGHLGFNDPGSALSSRTRVKRLSERTRRDNARFFTGLDDVPTHCVTQGLGTILDEAAAAGLRNRQDDDDAASGLRG